MARHNSTDTQREVDVADARNIAARQHRLANPGALLDRQVDAAARAIPAGRAGPLVGVARTSLGLPLLLLLLLLPLGTALGITVPLLLLLGTALRIPVFLLLLLTSLITLLLLTLPGGAILPALVTVGSGPALRILLLRPPFLLAIARRLAGRAAALIPALRLLGLALILTLALLRLVLALLLLRLIALRIAAALLRYLRLRGVR